MKSKPEEQNKRATNHPTQHHWHEMNRKQRREMMRKMQNEDLSLEVIHPDAGGIDIGNESHYVAVPPSRDSQSVREFGCTTAELKAMAVWLKQCRIRTVAMQSTGVYWVAVYDILEQAGLEVYLVNARDTKNLPGRKSDVQESQWLMKLHTYGLLRNSFRPSPEIRVMRTHWRQRNDLVQSAGWHIQRMQKALTQMNLQLANVLTDISGATHWPTADSSASAPSASAGCASRHSVPDHSAAASGSASRESPVMAGTNFATVHRCVASSATDSPVRRSSGRADSSCPGHSPGTPP